MEYAMKKLIIAAAVLAATSTSALAKPPIFAAECAGGTNAGGYNIDTDTEGHVWINGVKTTPKALESNYWIATSGHVEIDISQDSSGILVSFTGRHGANGMCKITAQ
jgi:hypothetical protein